MEEKENKIVITSNGENCVVEIKADVINAIAMCTALTSDLVKFMSNSFGITTEKALSDLYEIINEAITNETLKKIGEEDI